jgi:Fe-S-cluster containining protein
MHEPLQTSDGLDLSQAMRRVRRGGLFRSLERIYRSFPETECANCARCCFESPGIFYVEYLYLLDCVGATSAESRRAVVQRSLRELIFSWIEPERTCIFLESSRCTIYERRPLACRLFGLVGAAERDHAEAQARLAAREEAARLRRFGIDVPEAVVRRSLATCDRVRDARGRRVTIDGDAVAARVARLDAALLPREVVVREFCFRSLPERLGAAALGEGVVDSLRIQLLRRASRGEDVDSLLAPLLTQVQFPSLPPDGDAPT